MRGMIENMVLMQYLFFVFLFWKGGQEQTQYLPDRMAGSRYLVWEQV
jgi:hypothetical protein